jgi:hypothetical protein
MGEALKSVDSIYNDSMEDRLKAVAKLAALCVMCLEQHGE